MSFPKSVYAQADMRLIERQLVVKLPVLTLLVGTVALLVACGQVVTPQPTRTSLTTDTPTARAAADPAATQRSAGSSTAEVSSRPLPDTATPTVTPTPIVHVVQQGDTLQAIAFEFGVSVEALQRANGVENPQFLQVGQRLVIPVQDEEGHTTAGLLLPTPTPHPIRIQGLAFYETPVDSLLGLGEVANTTGITLTNVQVQVALLDTANESVAKIDTFVSLDILPPAVRSPFRVLFETPPEGWASYQATVIRGQEAGALATAYVPLSVVTAESSSLGPRFQVKGVVENVSAQRVAESVEVLVTTYDADGAVTGFRKAVVAPSPLTGEANDARLVPGAEMAFNLSLTTHGGIPDDFIVTALGRVSEGTIPEG